MTSCIHSKQSIIKKDIIDVVITVIDLPYILSSLNTIFYAFAEDSPTNQIISDIIIESISETSTNTIKPGKNSIVISLHLILPNLMLAKRVIELLAMPQALHHQLMLYQFVIDPVRQSRTQLLNQEEKQRWVEYCHIFII